MAERWEDFRDAFVQLDPVDQNYIARLMAAYVARQDGKATADDSDLIAQSLQNASAMLMSLKAGEGVVLGRAGNSSVPGKSQKGKAQKGGALAKRKRDAEGG